MLAKNSDEDDIGYHVPFHKYAGPGTNIRNKILEGVRPFQSNLDESAIIHDIEYMKPNNQWNADNNMAWNLARNGNYAEAIISRLAFLVKDLTGLKRKDKTDLNEYNQLKAIATAKGLINKNMSFSDT